MPAAADAILQDAQGRAVLRFERVLAHPPERVWAALTTVDDLRAWHPSPFELDGRRGGTVRFLPPDGLAFGDGEVTAWDPPRLLAHTWGEDALSWELRPHADGTLLVLTHTFDDRLKAARDAAGWHLCLDALERALAGEDGAGGAPAGWPELNAAYEQRFGIAAEEATPPPVVLGAGARLLPQLMFEGRAGEALRFYTAVFHPSRVVSLERYGAGEPGPEGTVKRAVLEIAGQRVALIDSPVEHPFTFTPSVSLMVECRSADAVDALFGRLSRGGEVLMPLDRYPFSDRFAWLNDRFGVSWQLMLVSS